MSKHLVPKDEFVALVERAKQEAAGKEAAWFVIADRILAAWYSTPVTDIWKADSIWHPFLDALTPGQDALVACASFYRGAKHDFITFLGEPDTPARTLKAFKLLGAQEYLDLLRQIEAVFPGRKFPEYAEDTIAALRKQPDGYFDKVADKFVSGKGMKRPLCDYIFEYVIAHSEDFSTPS